MLRFPHHSLDVSKLQVIDCVRQKIFEKQLKKDISMAQKQIAMVEFFSIFGSSACDAVYRNKCSRASI
jgi:hypothetical protein